MVPEHCQAGNMHYLLPQQGGGLQKSNEELEESCALVPQQAIAFHMTALSGEV